MQQGFIHPYKYVIIQDIQKGLVTPLVLVMTISNVCTSTNHKKKNIPMSPVSMIIVNSISPPNFFSFFLLIKYT